MIIGRKIDTTQQLEYIQAFIRAKWKKQPRVSFLHKLFVNGFCTASARDKHYEYCSSNGYVKVKMPSEIEKWLKFHDEGYQFKVLFMLYADLERILKPIDEEYREKMNKMKAERKGEAPYTEKINTHVTSGLVCT